MGDLKDPCLALPVPFCTQGFAPVPETCDLVFTLAVLFLAFVLLALVTWCKRPVFISSFSSKSYCLFEVLLSFKENDFNLILMMKPL